MGSISFALWISDLGDQKLAASPPPSISPLLTRTGAGPQHPVQCSREFFLGSF